MVLQKNAKDKMVRQDDLMKRSYEEWGKEESYGKNQQQQEMN